MRACVNELKEHVGMGQVQLAGFVQLVAKFSRNLKVQCTQIIFQLIHPARSNDRRSNAGLCDHPIERNPFIQGGSRMQHGRMQLQYCAPGAR